MPDKLANYLDSLKGRLKIDSTVKNDVAHELCTHLEERTQELKESGVSEEEAVKAATKSFGSPQLIAQQLYEVHSRGSWQEALFATLPHLLVALLFALRYWQNTILLSLTLGAIFSIVIYGWRRGKPVWLFPWLGYYLVPVIITGILLIYLPQGWTWIAALIYIPLALFILVYIVRQTANRDWLYTSLILLPLPIVFSWLLSLGSGNELLTNNVGIAQLLMNTPWIVVSFLTLAAITAISIRVGQRWCKAIALLVPTAAISISVALASRGNIDLWSWLIWIFSLLAFISPIWLQHRSELRSTFRHGSPQPPSIISPS